MKPAVIKKLMLLFVWVALMFFAVSVQAQMMGHEEMMGRFSKKEGMEQKMGMEGYGESSYGDGPFDVEVFKERLKLNNDQVEKLKRLRSDYRKEVIKRRANLRVAELELWELIDAKNLDMGKAEKKVREVEAMRSDLMLYRLKTLQETRKFLTDEQYEQFREIGFRSMRHMMGGHGMMGGMGGGMMGGMQEDHE